MRELGVVGLTQISVGEGITELTMESPLFKTQIKVEFQTNLPAKDLNEFLQPRKLYKVFLEEA